MGKYNKNSRWFTAVHLYKQNSVSDETIIKIKSEHENIFQRQNSSIKLAPIVLDLKNLSIIDCFSERFGRERKKKKIT